MKVSEALKGRHSARDFQNREVEEKKIVRILEAARYSPSGVNIQPWKVYVLKRDRKDQLLSKILSAFEKGNVSNPDYQYYPFEWFEPYKSRRVECGKKLYSALNIAREDKEARKEQWKRNYLAFSAPVVLFCFIDRKLEKGSWLDYGMFLQSIMLMAEEEGLNTCPQAALAEFPDVVREEINVSDQFSLVCGIALGYENKEHPANQYRTDRLELIDFVEFIG